MSKNINSFSQNINAITKNSVNTLAMLEAQQQAMTTNDTFTTFDYENEDGEKLQYQLPSYDAIINRLKAVEESIDSLHKGYGTINLEDGSRRTIRLTSVPHTPEQITGLTDPTEFTVDSNWFFEELMFPGAQVNIDLTGQIEDTADRVRVTRIILDANDSNAYALWESDLSQNAYDYTTLKTRLTQEGVSYYEDEETINMPLVQNLKRGGFVVNDDPILIDDNVWYPLDSISYYTVSTDGVDQGQNNVLSVGDRVSYSESIFEIREVDQNLMRVRLKRVSGVQTPGTFSTLNYYEDPFRDKTIKVRFGAHELNIIYFKGVAEDYNLLGNSWSTPIKFASDELILSGTTGQSAMSFDEYYSRFIVDWGSKMIAEAKENRQTAWNGKIPNAPTLNGSDFRVVQINTQINAAMDTTDVKNTASEIESVKSQISSLKSTIAAQKTELQSAESLYRYNSIQQQIATNIVDLNNLQTTYSTLVNSFQSIVRENSAITTEPKYHIRGFFPIPDYKYRDEAETVVEEIIGFDIAYRYIREDNTASQLNTFTYTAPDGTEYTGTFTDWNVIQGPLKTKIYDEDLGRYVWKTENIADGTETNINQIDIAISKGEKVEIKVRTISEAGYPENPLRSEWSNSIIMEFPSTLATGNEMADLIKNVNDDALTITITNNLDSLGVTTHLDDTIPNTNSVNGMYFKHIAKNIAVEETGLSDAGTTVVNSVSLQDVIDKLKSQYTTIVEASENAVKVANEVAEVATKKHGWYDEKIAELISDTLNLDQNIKDVSADLHAIVRIQRDEEGAAHADIKAKKFIVLDTSNNEKVALVAQNDLLKVTNNTTNDFSEPSDILVKDVHLGTSENSLNESLATFALQTNVDDLSTRVRVINSSVADLSTRANSHEENINALRGRVTTNEQTISTYAVNVAERKLQASQLRLNEDNATAIVRPNGTGGIIVTDSFSGSNLGTVRVSDVIITESMTSGESDSVKSVIADVKSNSDSIDSLTTQYEDLKSDFDSIYTKTGSSGRLATENGNFTKLSADEVQSNEYILTSGTTFEPKDSDGNIVNARFANVLLQPDIDNAGASISLYSKINELQTYQDTYNNLISELNDNYTSGTDSELRLSYLQAKSQVTVPKIMLNSDTAKTYVLTGGNNDYMTINTFDGVHEKTDAAIGVYDVMLVNPSNGSEKISVRDYVQKLGSFSGTNSDTFTSGEGIKTIEMNQLQTMIMPELTSLQAEKMTTLTLSEMRTINLNSDMNYEGVMNARNMILHVKDLTFVDSSGNRRTLSEVIGELSNSGSGD